MHRKLWSLGKLGIALGILAMVLLAGCTFQGGGTASGDGGTTTERTSCNIGGCSETTEKSSPAPGPVIAVAIAGLAALVRRRMA